MSSIESIQKENAELFKIIEIHADEIDRCKSIIYELIGGLFNQKTQKYILNSHIKILLKEKYFSRTDIEKEEEQEEVDSIWPTTRQGDEHEKRICKMEEIIKQLEKRIINFEKKLL